MATKAATKSKPKVQKKVEKATKTTLKTVSGAKKAVAPKKTAKAAKR